MSRPVVAPPASCSARNAASVLSARSHLESHSRPSTPRTQTDQPFPSLNQLPLLASPLLLAAPPSCDLSLPQAPHPFYQVPLLLPSFLFQRHPPNQGLSISHLHNHTNIPFSPPVFPCPSVCSLLCSFVPREKACLAHEHTLIGRCGPRSECSPRQGEGNKAVSALVSTSPAAEEKLYRTRLWAAP